MRIRTLAGATLLALLSTPTAAVSGGWWSSIQLDDHVLGGGESVVAEAHVLFPEMVAAEAARERGGYHAYLLPEVDRTMLDDAMSQPYRDDWWQAPSGATWLGEVELSGWDSNLATATATFEVPRVPSGEYALMFCTAGCREPLADVVPLLQVRVFADAATARMARDVQGLSRQLTGETERLGARIAALREPVLGTAPLLREAMDDLARVEGSLAALRAEAERPAPPPAEGTPWHAPAGWFVAGLATAAAVMSWRRRDRDAAEEQERGLPAAPDDAGELITGPPVPISSPRR